MIKIECFSYIVYRFIDIVVRGVISIVTVTTCFFNDNIYSFFNVLNIIYCVFNFIDFIYWLLNFIYCSLNGFTFFDEFCNFRRILSSLFKTFFHDCFCYFLFSSS